MLSTLKKNRRLFSRSSRRVYMRLAKNGYEELRLQRMQYPLVVTRNCNYAHIARNTPHIQQNAPRKSVLISVASSIHPTKFNERRFLSGASDTCCN